MYSLVNLVADAPKFLCESETEREDDVECCAQRQFVRKLDDNNNSRSFCFLCNKQRERERERERENNKEKDAFCLAGI